MLSRRIAFGLVVASVAAASVLVRAGQQGSSQTPSPLPLSNPVRERGSSVTGAYEGWYNDKDGSIRMLVGYFNRNTAQELDVPIGPNNRIEPGGPDQGQPTHFLAARAFGVFTIKVPRDFGDKKLTWTLVANGFTNTITMHLKKDWIVEPFLDAASKNTPPVLKFQADGPSFTGPPSTIAATYTATVGQPLDLTTWASDEGAKVNVETSGRGRGRGETPAFSPLVESWSVFRGPGNVTFSQARPTLDRANGGKASTNATFSAPGDYILRLQANDSSGDGGGGFQCCWTNAHVAVAVKAGAASK
ncbi:MAG TPA: hypothetical protein VKB36_04185 [Vicinamibacterales bacterium]|nr:hypothetical protein [Vicinamibacterales bacterium]